MTSLFDTDVDQTQRVLDEAMADHALSRVLDHAADLGGRAGLRRLTHVRQMVSAAESQILAEYVTDDGDTRRAERLLDDGKTSRAEQRKKAARARAVGKNATLANKMASGEMSEEQVDVIADAATKTGGAAATNDDLIDKVANRTPEQGRSCADDFVADQATKDGVQTEHERQRTLRRASKYHSKAKGLDSIALDGDGPSSKLAWAEIEKRADEIYERDGGRELPKSDHPRTREQRLYDAAFELITGTLTQPNGHTKPQASGGATSGQPSAKPRRSTRPAVVIGLTVDQTFGHDPAAIATQIGLGLIPDSVVANYINDADLFAALYNRNGEPLWLARLNRYATATQMIALIIRDKACVMCGADHTKCQAHHSMPWNAPGNGRTDLDQLVLLCGPCHTRLHAENRTIYQDSSGIWKTRPATADETPPPRPTTSRNQIRRE